VGHANATTIYLKKELKAARQAVKELEAAVSSATCFREEFGEVLEECLRAVSRLEQVGQQLGRGSSGSGAAAPPGLRLARDQQPVAWASSAAPRELPPTPRRAAPPRPAPQAIAARETPELLLVASEVKVTAKRALTLVEVHGRRKSLAKLLNVINKKKIVAKIGMTQQRFSALLPPPERPSTSAPQHLGQAAGPPLERASSAASPGGARAPAGQVLRQGKHDKVFSAAYVPYNTSVYPHTCVWWSLGHQLEFYSEAAQCTTAFPIEGSGYAVTTVAIDPLGNVWTGHAKGYVRVRRKQTWVAPPPPPAPS
jgi:hypothetical protein